MVACRPYSSRHASARATRCAPASMASMLRPSSRRGNRWEPHRPPRTTAALGFERPRLAFPSHESKRHGPAAPRSAPAVPARAGIPFRPIAAATSGLSPQRLVVGGRACTGTARPGARCRRRDCASVGQRADRAIADQRLGGGNRARSPHRRILRPADRGHQAPGRHQLERHPRPEPEPARKQLARGNRSRVRHRHLGGPTPTQGAVHRVLDRPELDDRVHSERSPLPRGYVGAQQRDRRGGRPRDEPTRAERDHPFELTFRKATPMAEPLKCFRPLAQRSG